MSPLSCLLATISLIAPTCRGVMGVLRHPAMMVLVSFYPLVTSWGRLFVGHWVNAPRSSPQNVADQGQRGRLSNPIDDRNRLSRVWAKNIGYVLYVGCVAAKHGAVSASAGAAATPPPPQPPHPLSVLKPVLGATLDADALPLAGPWRSFTLSLSRRRVRVTTAPRPPRSAP